MFNIKEKADIYFIIFCIIALIAWLYSIFQDKNLLIPVFNLFCSILLAFITYLYLKETEKIREIGSEPEVIIDGYIDENWKYLIIENIWSWVAYDIKFIVPDYKYGEELEILTLNELVPFKNWIKYFRKNQRKEIFIQKAITNDTKNVDELYGIDQEKIEITITYKSRYLKEYKETFKIDLTLLELNKNVSI